MTVAAPAPATPRSWDVTRPHSLVQGLDWDRCVGSSVTADPTGGGVALQRRLEQADAATPLDDVSCALAVDRNCRLYLGVDGMVLSVSRATEADAVDRLRLYLGTPAPAQLGDFRPAEPEASALDPIAMVVDRHDRLFILDGTDQTVLVVDLWQRRITERIRLGSTMPPAQVAVDLAVSNDAVWVLFDGPPALARLDGRRLSDEKTLDSQTRPFRLAASPGGLLAVLSRDGDGTDRIHFLDGSPSVEIAGATDLAFETDERLVVGRGPEADLEELRRIGHRFARSGIRRGHRFAGCGLVRIEHGRVGYWDGTRLRRASPAPDRFERQGHITTFRLDSGRFENTWGRLFLDACIPRDTNVRVVFHTSDDPDDQPAAALTALPRRPLVRRTEGRELAWDRIPDDDPFETYEAPVLAPAGRYLWIRLHLDGNTRRSPQLRELRVEASRHTLLDKLPDVFSAEPDRADFLGRYLALVDGPLHDLDIRAALRHLLFDPHATPAEALDWLSSIVGLTHDQRWSIEARRLLLEEIVELFQRRGTIGSLTRMIEIYLGLRTRDSRHDRRAHTVMVLEHFRLRGVAGRLLGSTDEPTSTSVLGAGFRVGGSVGEPAQTESDLSSADLYAHRFTVVIPIPLSAEQRDVVNHLLEVHRPAHTLVEVCALDAGMRVGRGLHLSISSMVGHTGGFATYVVGDALLGRGSILGRPVVGERAGSTRAGRGRVG